MSMLAALIILQAYNAVSALTAPLGQADQLQGRQFGGLPGGGFGTGNGGGYGGYGNLQGFSGSASPLTQARGGDGGYGGYGGDAGLGGGYGGVGGGGYGNLQGLSGAASTAPQARGGGYGGYGGDAGGGYGGGDAGGYAGSFAPIGHPTKNPALGLPFQWGLYTYGDLGGYSYGYKPYYTGYAYPLPTPFGEYPNDDSYPGFPDIIHPSSKGTHKIVLGPKKAYSGAYGSTYGGDSTAGGDSTYGGSSPGLRDATQQQLPEVANGNGETVPNASPSYGMMNNQRPLVARSAGGFRIARRRRR